MRRKLKTQCSVLLGCPLALLNEVRLPGAHAPNFSATDFDEIFIERKLLSTESIRVDRKRKVVCEGVIDGKEKFMHEHIVWIFHGDRGVQRNVRSRFRLHPRIAESEASFLFEFTRKLLVKPPVTVSLSFCPAAFHDDSLSYCSEAHRLETVTRSDGAFLVFHWHTYVTLLHLVICLHKKKNLLERLMVDTAQEHTWATAPDGTRFCGRGWQCSPVVAVTAQLWAWMIPMALL